MKTLKYYLLFVISIFFTACDLDLAERYFFEIRMDEPIIGDLETVTLSITIEGRNKVSSIEELGFIYSDVDPTMSIASQIDSFQVTPIPDEANVSISLPIDPSDLNKVIYFQAYGIIGKRIMRSEIKDINILDIQIAIDDEYSIINNSVEVSGFISGLNAISGTIENYGFAFSKDNIPKIGGNFDTVSFFQNSKG